MQNVLRLAALVAVVQFLEVKCGHVPPPSVVVRSRGDTTASPHSPSASSEDASSPSFLTLIACRGGSAAAPSAVPTSAAASAPSPTPGPPPASWASTGFMRPSKRIDDQGFLREVFVVVDGTDEETGHQPGRSTPFHARLRCRQVPGDGSCLFHSLTASLSLLVNGTHHALEIEPLKWHSNYLRHKAVDIFEQEPNRVLWLQGNEKMTCAELLAAVAEQFNVSPEEYLINMRKPSEWGGGPEIVVLANVLRRPIHVYELQACTADDDDKVDGDVDATANGERSGGITGGSSITRRPSWLNGGSNSNGGGLLRRAMNLRHGCSTTAITARGGAFASSSGTGVQGEVAVAPSGWRLRRIACFGSPKFDRANTAVHILSADSRFPDLKPGDQLPNGNHFLALFPVDTGSDTRKNIRSSSSSSSSSGRRAHEYSAVFDADEKGAATGGGGPFRVFAFWRWPFPVRPRHSNGAPSSATNAEESGNDGKLSPLSGLKGTGESGNSSTGILVLKQLSDIVHRAAGIFTGPLERSAAV